ncbi:hypothetical protein [Bacillus albus]|uniref:hypothetical protein n=1 Tax=Bacillus albus TaxID=2026189 RepID=UPI003D1A9C57
MQEQEASLPQERQYGFGGGDGFRPKISSLLMTLFPNPNFSKNIFRSLLLSLLLSLKSLARANRQ